MSGVVVNLHEWETVKPVRGHVLSKRDLAGSDAERRLAEQLTATKRIEILELVPGLELRATSFVGRFRLGELTVTIQPKLSGAPLLSLLRYAYGLRHLTLYDSVEYPSAQFTFLDLLIQQLAAETRELLARGIHRDYERRESELATPRGRIDFNRYARMACKARATLPCIEHPRAEDTLLNQVLLAGLVCAGRMTNDLELRSQVKRLSQILATGVSEKRLDRTVLAEAMVKLDRRTTAYEPALKLIEILLLGEGMSLDEEKAGQAKLPGFLFDMNLFFQALLSRFLRENLDGYDLVDQYRVKGLFQYDQAKNPLHRKAPVQRPDFVVRQEGKIVSVLDAKYRDLWEKELPPSMLYQLALYALAQNGPMRRASILYPTMDEAACEQAIVVREPTSGASRADVVLRPVKLLELDKMIRDRSTAAEKRRKAYAKRLAFGE